MGKGAARPMQVDVHVDGLEVALVIVGTATLRMPADAAHQVARALINAACEIDRRTATVRPAWPPLSTKGNG